VFRFCLLDLHACLELITWFVCAFDGYLVKQVLRVNQYQLDYEIDLSVCVRVWRASA
jgi:hypothetical protein